MRSKDVDRAKPRRARVHMKDASYAAGVVALAVLAALVSAREDADAALALIAVLVGAVGLLILPLSVLLFLFGLLLPIHQVAGVPELVLDLARYALAAGLILRCRPTAESRGLRAYEIALLVAAVWLTGVSWSRSDSGTLYTAGVMGIATLVVYLLRSRELVTAQLWFGYVTSAAFNSGVITLQGVGTTLPFVSDEFAGYGRYVGLGANAPLVSFELAVALVLALSVPRALPRLTAQALILVGLLVCGGRGGLVALVLAIVVVLAVSKRHRSAAIGVVLVGGTSGLLLGHSSLSFSTLERILDPNEATSDVTSGRADLLRASLMEFLGNPVFGIGLQAFDNRYGATPHMAVLNFAIAGGIVPALCVAVVALGMIRSGLLRRNASSPAVALVAIFLVWMLLEPTGPFVGLVGLLLLAYVMSTSEIGTDKKDRCSNVALPEVRQLRNTE
jgi:hypothetical protein